MPLQGCPRVPRGAAHPTPGCKRPHRAGGHGNAVHETRVGMGHSSAADVALSRGPCEPGPPCTPFSSRYRGSLLPCAPLPSVCPPACSQGRGLAAGDGRRGRAGREEEGMGVLSVPLLRRQNRGCWRGESCRCHCARWATLCRSNLRAPRGQPPPPPPPPPWVRPSSPPPAGLPSSSLIPLVPLSVRLVRLRPSGLQVGDIGKVILL